MRREKKSLSYSRSIYLLKVVVCFFVMVMIVAVLVSPVAFAMESSDSILNNAALSTNQPAQPQPANPDIPSVAALRDIYANVLNTPNIANIPSIPTRYEVHHHHHLDLSKILPMTVVLSTAFGMYSGLKYIPAAQRLPAFLGTTLIMGGLQLVARGLDNPSEVEQEERSQSSQDLSGPTQDSVATSEQNQQGTDDPAEATAGPVMLIPSANEESALETFYNNILNDSSVEPIILALLGLSDCKHVTSARGKIVMQFIALAFSFSIFSLFFCFLALFNYIILNSQIYNIILTKSPQAWKPFLSKTFQFTSKWRMFLNTLYFVYVVCAQLIILVTLYHVIMWLS